MTAKENYLKLISLGVNTITCACGYTNDVTFWNCKKCGKRLQ